MRVAVLSVCAVGFMVSACEVQTTHLTCSGTVQKPANPVITEPVEHFAVRFERYPALTRVWSRSEGSVKLSEPVIQYYSYVDDIGDQLLFNEVGATSNFGMFNKVGGRLRVAVGRDLYDVRCREAQPLVP